VEFWPGSGWYTEILAPYLAHGAGTFIGALFPEGPTADPAQAALNAAFRTRFSSDRRLFGEPQFSIFGAASGPVAPPGTADMALFLRTLRDDPALRERMSVAGRRFVADECDEVGNCSRLASIFRHVTQ
jgi:predicted methyltransferase